MNGIFDVVPIVCSCCHFHFEWPDCVHSAHVVCPVCGVSQACVRPSFLVPPGSETASSSILYPPIRTSATGFKNWNIPLITVCFQCVAFALGIVVILSSLDTRGRSGKSLAERQPDTTKELVLSESSPSISVQLTSLTYPTLVQTPKKNDVTTTDIPNNTLEPAHSTTKPEKKRSEPVETLTSEPEEKKAESVSSSNPTPDKGEASQKALTCSDELEKVISPQSPPLTYEERLQQAMATLAEGGILYTTDSIKSIQLTTQAIGQLRELGQSIPSEAYWILGQSFATQSWGESLSEGFPPIENLAVSTDGRWLLMSGMDRTVWIWDFSRRHMGEEFKLGVVDAPLVKLLFTPDLRLAIGGTVDGKIYLWRTTLRHPMESMVVLPDQVQGLRDLQVSPDGRWLVAYGGPPNPSPTPIKKDREHDPLSNSLRRTLFGDIVTASWQEVSETVENGLHAPSQHDPNAIWLWDIQTLQSKSTPPTVLRGHEKQIHALAISNDSRWLVTGGEDAAVRLYDLKATSPGAEQMVLKGHRLDVTAIAIAPDNAWIASGSRDNTIRIWQQNGSFSPTNPTVLEGHLGWISSLVTDGTGERLISGSYDKTIRIWTLAKDRLDCPPPSTVIYGDQGVIRQLAVTHDGKKLVSQGIDTSLRIYDLEGNYENEHTLVIRNRTLPISKLSFSPDGRWLIFNYDNLSNLSNCGVRVWPLQLDDLLEMVKNEL